MKRLTIRVQNTARREDYHQSYALPVTIGRAGDNDVSLDEHDTEASRYHAELSTDGTDIFLKDRSLNGTRVPSGTIRNETIRLRTGDQFTISGYRFTLSVPAVYTLRHTDRTGRPLATFDLMPGGGVVAAWTGGRLIVEAVGSHQEMERRYGAAGACLYFQIAGDKPMLNVVSNRQQIDITVNKTARADDKLDLNALDVIHADGERFDIVRQGEDTLVCGNCHQLVPYKVQGQCHFCGFDLTSGHTVLVRPFKL